MESILKSQLIRRKNVRFWENISHYYAVLMLIILPLFFNNTLYMEIDVAKWHSFLVFAASFIAICCFAFPTIYCNKKLKILRIEDGRQKLSVAQIILLAFFGLSCISALLSDYGLDCILGQSRHEGLLSLFLYLGVFFCLSFWGEYSDDYFYAFAVPSVIIGIIAIVQLFGSDIFYPENSNYYNTQFLSTIGNIDLLSGYISCALPIIVCSYILFDEKTRFYFTPGIFLLSFTHFAMDVDTGKLALLASFGLVLPFLVDTKKKTYKTIQVIGLVFSSYGLSKFFDFSEYKEGKDIINTPISPLCISIIIIGIAFFILGIVFEKKVYKTITVGKKKSLVETTYAVEAATIRKYLYIFIFVSILAILAFLFFYTGSNALLKDLHEFTHGRISDEAGNGRGLAYKDTIKIIKENPWFGTGPGTFKEAYKPYITTLPFDVAHCDLLQIAACQGLFSLVAYIAFIVVLTINAIKYASRFYPIIIMSASIIGYLVFSVLNFSSVFVSPVFWIIAGILDKTFRQVASSINESSN